VLRALQENALRNMALLAAKTELVLLGDVDLLAGAELRDAVSDARRWSCACCAVMYKSVHHGALAEMSSKFEEEQASASRLVDSGSG
jgi:hypothetical protein